MNLLLLALATLAPQEARPARDAAEPERDFIYYDYLEDGVLRGGIVRIDPDNPLHSNLGGPATDSGSSAVVLVDNGPSSNRIDLVFVGDGYTAGELGAYAADVDSIYPTFFDEPPLDAYLPFFNVHRVDVISNESGVDNDPTQGISRDTALDMGFWCGGTERLLCVNVGAAVAEASMAQGRDQVLAVANSSKYGGAGYNDLGTLSGNNSAAIEIALHEFGHSFADLADEYTYGGSQTYTGGEPSQRNVSIYDSVEMANLTAKWHLWLDHPNVSTFEGGFYSQFGIYRPTFNSKMRNLNRPFEQVNTERFIRHIYLEVDPIDDATPAGDYGLTDSFFVTTVEPLSHALDVQWFLDGGKISGATGKTFDASSLSLAPGNYALTVEVVDNTPLVRSPHLREKHLTSRRTWHLVTKPGLDPYVGGVPDAGGLVLLEGRPSPGNTLVFGVAPSQETAAGEVPVLLLSTAGLAGRRAPALGAAVGPRFLTMRFGTPWGGSGSARVRVRIPGDPALAGVELHAQGFWYEGKTTRKARHDGTNVIRISIAP